MEMRGFKFKALVEKLVMDGKNRELEKRFFVHFDNVLFETYKDKLIEEYDTEKDVVELTITLNDITLNDIAEKIAKNEIERMNITQTSIVEKMIRRYCESMNFGFVKGAKIQGLYDNTIFCTIIVNLKEKDGE